MNDFPQHHLDEAAFRSLLAPLRDAEAVQPARELAQQHLAAMIDMGERRAQQQSQRVTGVTARSVRRGRFQRRTGASLSLAAVACAVFAMVAVGVVTSDPQSTPIGELNGNVPDLVVDTPLAETTTSHQSARAGKRAVRKHHHAPRRTAPAATPWRTSAPASSSSSGGGSTRPHGNTSSHTSGGGSSHTSGGGSSHGGAQGGTSGSSSSGCSAGSADDGQVRALSVRDAAATTPPDDGQGDTPPGPPEGGGTTGGSGGSAGSVGASGGCGGAP